VARLMVDAGLITICAFVSPFAADRETLRSLFEPGEFVEVFVDLPVELAAERDRKGLYGKAERGELANLTGWGAPYEPPERPDLRLDMAELSGEEAAESVVGALRDLGLLS
jgi:bifunctional enzyme CysN/CysC